MVIAPSGIGFIGCIYVIVKISFLYFSAVMQLLLYTFSVYMPAA
jgi:hypothetical protein